MSGQVGAVFDGPVHLESVVLARVKVLDISQYHAFPIHARFPFELHVRQPATVQFGFRDVGSSMDLDRRLLHFQVSPFEAVGLQNDGR